MGQAHRIPEGLDVVLTTMVVAQYFVGRGFQVELHLFGEFAKRVVAFCLEEKSPEDLEKLVVSLAESSCDCFLHTLGNETASETIFQDAANFSLMAIP